MHARLTALVAYGRSLAPDHAARIIGEARAGCPKARALIADCWRHRAGYRLAICIHFA